LPEDTSHSFRSELALGASYTTSTEVTINLEYHFDQSAFSAADWEHWFAVGESHSGVAAVTSELWFIRSYAADQQQPISRHSIFLRADCADAFTRKLDLSGFVDTDLLDGSSLLQLGASYFVSDEWTVGALVIGYFGPRRSDFGSLPLAATFLFDFARYL